MKTLAFLVLVLFSSYSYAINYDELVDRVQDTRIRDFPCVVNGKFYVCDERVKDGVEYRWVIDNDWNVVHIFTPESSQYPDGEVTPEELINAGSL